MRSLLPLALALSLGLQTAASAQGAGAGPGRGEGGAARQRCDAPEPTEQEDDGKIYAPSELTCRAVIVSRAEPEYRPGRRRKGERGSALVRVVLLASGKVGAVEVVRAEPGDFADAAIKAARLIKFRPAIRGDRWVSQRVLVEYNFNTY